MKRKVCLFMVIIVALLMIGCENNTSNMTEASNLTNASNDNTTNNKTDSMEKKNIESSIEDVKGTEAASQDTQESENDKAEYCGTDFGEKFTSWQEGYRTYLEENNAGEEYQNYTYAFIYVDDDSIPEIVCDSSGEAGGCQILTYNDGRINVLQTSRLYFSYTEKGNLLCNSDGHMGYYYDDIFSIQNGKWINVANGTYGFTDDGGEIKTDENGDYVNDNWNWEGKKLSSQKEYDTSLNEVYPVSSSVVPEKYYDKTEALSFINTGTYLSAAHTYDFVKEDTTWTNAFKDCKSRGGYLATITCKEEFEKIENQIASTKDKCAVYFVGANRKESGLNWIEHGDLKERVRMPFNVYYHGEMWMEHEPSYTGTTETGEQVDEDVLAIMYISSDKRYYLVDVPDNILDAAPSYSGNVGYICEYDKGK